MLLGMESGVAAVGLGSSACYTLYPDLLLLRSNANYILINFSCKLAIYDVMKNYFVQQRQYMVVVTCLVWSFL
jgi:hypothetical protein